MTTWTKDVEMAASRTLAASVSAWHTVAIIVALAIACTPATRRGANAGSPQALVAADQPTPTSSVKLETYQVFRFETPSEPGAIPYATVTDVDEPQLVQLWSVIMIDGGPSSYLVTDAQVHYDAEARELRVGSLQLRPVVNPAMSWYEIRTYRDANYDRPAPGPTPTHLEQPEGCLPDCLGPQTWDWLKSDTTLICPAIYRENFEPHNDDTRSLRCLCAIIGDVEDDYDRYQCAPLLGLTSKTTQNARTELDARLSGASQ